LDPDAITIDAKYGTLDVNADGSFVFDPSPDIVMGTYVQFYYNATNGACAAKVPGFAKIQVSCKCRPQVADVILCLPTTLDAIKEKLEAAGVGCLACGATPTVIDLSKVKPEPGTYSFSIKCSGCQAASGSVTLVPACTAVAPDLKFCEPVEIDQVLAGITAAADCAGTGCDQAPIIDATGLTVVDGLVPGGSYTYTATCRAGTECANTATGTITVVPRCEVELIGVTFGCGTPAEIEAQIEAENPSPCGDCDSTPTFQFPVWPLRVDGTGYVANGIYQYTVTCNAGGLEGCDSAAPGEVIVLCDLACPCVATAENVTVCKGLVTLDQLEDDYLPGNVSCRSTIGTICDITADIDMETVTVDSNGFVTGGTYKAICQSNTDDCLPVEATGTVTTKDCNVCTCEANAPDICVPLNYSNGYHQYTLDEIENEITANGGGCGTDDCDMTLKFYNRYGVEIPSFADLYWNAPRHYTYEVICTKGTCVKTARGKLDVLSLVDCSCTTCC